MTMTKRRVRSIAELVDAIGAGCDPHDSGPVAVIIGMQDGRTITGSYHRLGGSTADVFSEEDILLDDSVLRPFVERLLDKGVPFVTETGEDDMVCTLRWEILGAQ